MFKKDKKKIVRIITEGAEDATTITSKTLSKKKIRKTGNLSQYTGSQKNGTLNIFVKKSQFLR